MAPVFIRFVRASETLTFGPASPTLQVLLGMSRNYTIADVLAYMNIPLPEEDDLSDDGYIE